MADRSTREQLDLLGRRILNASRTELTLAMRFLAAPLNALDYIMDLSTTTVGTDAAYIRFHPHYLFRLYREEPARLNRAYLHMLLHCLFGHMFSAPQYAEKDLWDLACDIAVEHIIDGMDDDSIRRVTSDYRERVYDGLLKEVRVLTAEKIYHYYVTRDRDVDEEAHLAHEFFADDHGFWARMQPPERKEEQDTSPLPEVLIPPMQFRQLKEQWARERARVKSEMDLLSKEASKETGSLSWTLAVTDDTRTDFRTFLRRLSHVREEARPDPDHFDMGLYHYGLARYGNLPLIEELELREAKKIDELVIAIDTSASCARELVQHFLNETAAILRRQESFFHRVDVRIIECDDRIQKEIALKEAGEIDAYAGAFTMKGGYGTDFRPVFDHVRDLRAHGELRNLRGLLYFTDGYGVYPATATTYDTAFVFDRESDCNDRDVPAWAMRLYV